MQVDVAHADVPHTNGLINGDARRSLSPAAPSSSPPSAAIAAVSISTPAETSDAPTSEPAVQSSLAVNDTSHRDDDDVEQPPTKRARKFSDADMASAHASASPPPLPVSTAAAPPQSAPEPAPAPALADPSRATTLSVAQHKFAVSTVRTLKKLKDAAPFKLPVDPVALGIPHYFNVVKHPMDMSTIEHKLASSNPAKPDSNPNNPRYATADEFIADVRLMFTNSITFNGPDHPVTLMGKRVEEVFDKQIKHLPAPEEVRAEPSWARPTIGNRPPKPAPVKKAAASPPPPPPPVAPKAAVQRRPSTTVPPLRRNETENTSRPKREIHPPPTKELPYANEPKKRRRSTKAGAPNEQLKYCAKILDQLGKKQHWHTVSPFSEPVDWVKLQIPDYPKIVKKPMDLRTMREKLDSGDYPNAEKFRQDFLLIFKNCFAYNAPGTPVNQAGIELQHLFEEKWRGLPPERRAVESEDEDEEDEDEDDDLAGAIAAMEQQMASMRESIEAMKAKSVKKTKVKEPKKKKPAPPPEPVSAPVPSSSKPKKESRPPPPKKKGSSKKVVIPDDDVLSFDQKKELSDAITTLDGSKLERVISIIHEGVPEIRDSQEEIELEIDSLPAAVLTKLYNFVIRPMRQPPPKKARTGKGTGTGGLKRKSMDEEVEEAKIRKLEAQMRLFEDAENGGASSAPSMPHATAATNGGGHESSDSSSDDDSSGSDSE
ncbi:Bromodomain-containing protein [Vararia minispora EC-137]|uniref:Bromodomain-containing protein n=1 Tax=Vararia minispora EC-137 TaxID=1314806 RepID=A0ACB8QSW7_9AGAM|nr:Bromodomain-containing protein [Vararia minispora EC-137]